MNKMKMTKLARIRITLIMLQFTSLTIASIIIIIYYNPWIGRIIDEAERSGNTGRSLANQIRRTDNEELVIFLMSATTILVSLLGIIGALRNYEHNHCLLNFYMSTLIIFLFVVFVAFCGTVWEIFGKLHRSTVVGHQHHFSHTTHSNLFQNADHNSSYLESDIKKTSNNSQEYKSDSYDSIIRPPGSNAQLHVSWWYIGKSLLLITFSATLYATSLKLTRTILESSDDRYLSANECESVDGDDLNSEGSVGHNIMTYPYTCTTSSSRFPYHFNSSNMADVYAGHMMGSSKSSLGSQFRTIL